MKTSTFLFLFTFEDLFISLDFTLSSVKSSYILRCTFWAVGAPFLLFTFVFGILPCRHFKCLYNQICLFLHLWLLDSIPCLKTSLLSSFSRKAEKRKEEKLFWFSVCFSFVFKGFICLNVFVFMTWVSSKSIPSYVSTLWSTDFGFPHEVIYRICSITVS